MSVLSRILFYHRRICARVYSELYYDNDFFVEIQWMVHPMVYYLYLDPDEGISYQGSEDQCWQGNTGRTL